MVNDATSASRWAWCSDYRARPGPASSRARIDHTGRRARTTALKISKLEAASKLAEARLKALGKLDLEIMKKLAPVAVMRTYNNRYFFSDRVDPRSLVYQQVYLDWSIPALALK